MYRSILLFGLIAGVWVATLTLIGTTVANPIVPDLFDSVVNVCTILGMLGVVLYAIKHVRDRQPDAKINFPPAVVVGFGVSLLASAVYVMAWEIYFFANDYTFARLYSEGLIDRAQLLGITDSELALIMEAQSQSVELFNNAFFRVTSRFLGMFTVGGLVSLVGAFVLRNPDVLSRKAE